MTDIERVKLYLLDGYKYYRVHESYSYVYYSEDSKYEGILDVHISHYPKPWYCLEYQIFCCSEKHAKSIYKDELNSYNESEVIIFINKYIHGYKFNDITLNFERCGAE